MATCERHGESNGPDDDKPVHDRTESPPGDGFVGEVLAIEGDRVVGMTQASTCPAHDRFAGQPGGGPTDDLGKSEFVERYFLGGPAILHVDDVAVARVDPLVRDKTFKWSPGWNGSRGIPKLAYIIASYSGTSGTMEQYWAAEGAEEQLAVADKPFDIPARRVLVERRIAHVSLHPHQGGSDTSSRSLVVSRAFSHRGWGVRPVLLGA
jgi:hypothetical protein